MALCDVTLCALVYTVGVYVSKKCARFFVGADVGCKDFRNIGTY
jgi:hypothetical protein